MQGDQRIKLCKAKRRQELELKALLKTKLRQQKLVRLGGTD